MFVNLFFLGKPSIKKKLRKFGHMSKLGLPYLPRTLVWTKISLDKYSIFYPTYLSKKFGHFENKVCSLTYIFSILQGFYWLIIKLISIGMTWNIKKFLPNYHQLWDYVYFHRYGHQHLTYLPWKFMSKLFFWKKYGSKIPYLPTVWTYVQNFCSFFWDPSLRRSNSFQMDNDKIWA